MYQALVALYKEKPLEEISITGLVETAMVGRSTFYRNFDQLSDIPYWKCDAQFAQVLGGYLKQGQEGGEPLELLRYVFGYWQNHFEVLKILLDMNRIDIIYDCFAKNSYLIMDALMKKKNLTAGQYEYFIATRIGIFVGVMQTWLRRGRQESSEQIAAMLGGQMLPAADELIL